jgi:catechol 2,3-dioxygenase-like lactoylglutathione lyase family enzyme
MNRFHVHVAVADLDQSVRFYSALFAAEPTVSKPDYAKWMLDDPRVNFAISKRGQAQGLDHLGIQAEGAEELAELERRLQAANLPHLAQPGSNCCYAQSDKHWSLDPSGIPWETFHTLGAIPIYGEHERPAAGASCCGPAQQPAAGAAPTCGEQSRRAANTGCCGSAQQVAAEGAVAKCC